MSGFQRAVVGQTKARVAFYGVGGSGKTTQALTLARSLAGPDGTIALLDTEGGSSSKYADAFVFDMDVMRPPFHPRRFVEVLESAAASGYAVFVADGISPFWSGAGGVQTIVDTSSKKWAEGTPAWQSLVNAIVLSPIHVVLTVRAKSDTLVDKDDRGKVQIRKVGLKPDAREGIEYEVDVLAYCDVLENLVTMEKTRLRGQMGMTLKPDRWLEWCEGYAAWLAAGAPAPPAPAAPPPPAPAPAAAPVAAPPPAPAPADPTGGLAPAAAQEPSQTLGATGPQETLLGATGTTGESGPTGTTGESGSTISPERIAIRERIKTGLANLKTLDAATDYGALVKSKIPEWFPGNAGEATLDDAQADELATKIEATLELVTNRSAAS